MPAKRIVRWYPASFIATIEGNLERNLDMAGEFLQADIQHAFPGGGTKGTRSGGSGGAHSAPGGIPFVQSGTLKRSIRWERAGKLVRRIGSILQPQGNIPSYALLLEYGTKAHIIEAKNAKVLANKETGQIFGKRVHHPGMAARPWMRPALDRNNAKLMQILSRR